MRAHKGLHVFVYLRVSILPVAPFKSLQSSDLENSYLYRIIRFILFPRACKLPPDELGGGRSKMDTGCGPSRLEYQR
jgi:hypothetical protein